MSPYVDQKEEKCCNCPKPAFCILVFKKNGFCMPFCFEHLIEFATTLKGK
jgi:hypothetical protein